MMARRRHPELTDSGFRISEMCSLCGVDTTELTASPLIFPVGLACHGTSSDYVGASSCKALGSQYFHRWDLVRGYDHQVSRSAPESGTGKSRLKIINDLPVGFPINNIISLE